MFQVHDMNRGCTSSGNRRGSKRSETNSSLRVRCLARTWDYLSRQRDRQAGYGFRFLGSQEDRFLRQNTTIPVEELYAQTAESLLCHGTSLDALTLACISMEQESTSL